MKGDPWQAQVCASGHWTSMSHDAETGETFAAWRLA